MLPVCAYEFVCSFGVFVCAHCMSFSMHVFVCIYSSGCVQVGDTAGWGGGWEWDAYRPCGVSHSEPTQTTEDLHQPDATMTGSNGGSKTPFNKDANLRNITLRS